jgi:phenylpyruvate tautomerase PptA (4-oxalocrotonate tautomerase family)
MPIIVCECRTGLSAGTKANIANKVTDVVRSIILSPLDLISVVFHELRSENTYRSGLPTDETLIFCHIRDGRSDAAVLALAKGVSAAWSECTGDQEEHIEVAVQLYPAKYVVRGGEQLPEAPRV